MSRRTQTCWSAAQGEFWIGCDRKTLYIAVRSAVHPTLGALAKYAPRDTDQDVVFDDAIEIWVDNSPGSDTGQYFQIMVNPNGAFYEARYNHRDKIAQKYWRADLRQAHTVKDGVWTAEVAIDLASLGVTDPTQPLAMRVCRDYKNPWDQARWEARVHGFEAPETMARVRFADAAPVVDELPVQDAQGVTVGLALSNPTDQPLPLHVRLGYNAQDQPRYFQDTDVTLAPGAGADGRLPEAVLHTGRLPRPGRSAGHGRGGEHAVPPGFQVAHTPAGAAVGGGRNA